MATLLARGILGGAAFTVIALGAACGAFLADDPPSEALDAGTPDGPIASEASTIGEGGAPPSGPCALARAPSCEPAACTQRVLYANDKARGAPWGIAVDESFVYWLEQPPTKPDGYNGHAAARLLRVPKAARQDPSTASELVTGQARAVTIALDGGWVYWTVYAEDDGGAPLAKLRRVRKDCAADCKPEELVVPATGVRIVKLVPTTPGTIFGLGEAGQVFRFDVGGPGMAMAGPLIDKDRGASLVATDQHVYVSSARSTTITRMGLDGSNIEADAIEIPPHDVGDPGLTNMWTDCTDVWARRGPPTELVRFSLAKPVFETRVAAVALNLYDVAGDAEYLYLAGADEGLHALARSGSKAVAKVAGRKAFAVAVDADGVYWGEHDTDSGLAGTIYMLVK